ncbi:hypothetical protein ES703_102687 [subsurface metagenome]
MTIEWTDTTSYSRDERGKKAPTCWSWQGERLHITVTCGHIYAPGQWVMHAWPLGIDIFKLNVKTKELAQEKAIRITRKCLTEMVAELPSMSKEE